MNGRTPLTLAVLAAAGFAAANGGQTALDLLLPHAQAQAAGESDTQIGESQIGESQIDEDRDTSSDAEQSLERAETELQRAENQIARAAGAEAGAGMALSALRVERSEHGQHIADQDGRALYLLEGESNGESNCYDRCAEQWPPAIVAQGQTAETQGRRVDEELLGTFDRRDGSTQLTYGDYPLYYYYMDQEEGDVTGHDVHDEWGGWYLITPDGEPLESEEAEDRERDRG